MKKYIKIYATQYSFDYTVNPPVLEYVDYEARPCKESDFNKTHEMKEIYKKLMLGHAHPVCMDHVEDFHMQNSLEDPLSGRAVTFNIDICKGPLCAPKAEIENYVDVVNVRAYGVFDRVQYTKREGKPFFKELELISQTPLQHHRF